VDLVYVLCGTFVKYVTCVYVVWNKSGCCVEFVWNMCGTCVEHVSCVEHLWVSRQLYEYCLAVM